MAETPDPQSVGRELVRQYYTMLNERPDCLHRFFSQNSSYVHGGVEKPGEELPPVKGQLAIHQKIMSLGFKDCHAKIRQVDCQETVGGAVVIQVTGELSNNCGPMRRFMQTFVLARQAPKMFYLHNDIFRYQDEVFHDGDAGTDVNDQQQDVPVEQELPEVEKTPAEPAFIQPPPTSVPVSDQKVAAVVSSVPDEEKSLNAADTQPAVEVKHQEEVPSTEDQLSAAVKEVNITDSAVAAADEKKEPSPAEVVETETHTQLPVQKPFSWASLAGKSASSASGSATSQTPAPPKPQATIKPERKADSSTVSQNQPLPQRASRSGPQRSEPAVISDSHADRKWASSFESGDGKSSSGPVIPDNQQLFVGNLPHNAEDKDLVEFFSKFGNVVDVKINKKGMTRDLPNFGFVSFDSPEAVTKALAAKPLQLYGRHRLNVEEKKEQSELFSRPRGGTRGRGGSSYRGSYRGGRGGHFTASAQSGGPLNSGSQI